MAQQRRDPLQPRLSAATLLLAVCWWCGSGVMGQQDSGGVDRRQAVQDRDLVIATGTCGARLELGQATGRLANEVGRAGVRLLFALENATLADELQAHVGLPRNETYLSWPDRPALRTPGGLPGDARVGLTPWLAHRALGDSYKWLLLGDYDPDLPYVIADTIWHSKERYSAAAPRCLPCHGPARPPGRPPKRRPNVGGGAEVELLMPPLGCPCTPELACNFTLAAMHRSDAAVTRAGRPFQWCPESKEWGFPDNYPTVCDYPHFHGGSGYLVSVGAMRKVTWEAALRCFYDDPVSLAFTDQLHGLRHKAHGDRLTALCFWLNGVALTDPGFALRPGDSIETTRLLTDNRVANLDDLALVAQGGRPGNWGESVLNMTSVHLHGRAHRNAVRYAHALAAAYRKAYDAVRERLRPEVA